MGGDSQTKLPSMLAAPLPTTTVLASAIIHFEATTLLPVPMGSGYHPSPGGGRPHCTYFNKDGNAGSTCFKQKRHLSCGSSTWFGAL